MSQELLTEELTTGPINTVTSTGKLMWFSLPLKVVGRSFEITLSPSRETFRVIFSGMSQEIAFGSEWHIIKQVPSLLRILKTEILAG